jgi:hypothetical protein
MMLRCIFSGRWNQLVRLDSRHEVALAVLHDQLDASCLFQNLSDHTINFSAHVQPESHTLAGFHYFISVVPVFTYQCKVFA